MPVMNFDLEDGQPPVSFNLKPQDCERMMLFMAECQAAKERTWVGLTDEEARQIREEANLSFQPEETRQKIVQELVEAKLKEKNT